MNTTKTETKDTASTSTSTGASTGAPKASSQANPFAAFATNPFAAGTNPFEAFGSFDPMAAFTQAQTQFTKLWTDAFGQAQSFAAQYGEQEQQMVKRAQGAVASVSQLAQDAIAYAGQLSAQARKLSFEAAQKMHAGTN